MATTTTIHCLNLGRDIATEKGSTARDLALRLENELGFTPLLARINNRYENLSYDFYHPAQVEFLSLGSTAGQRAYLHSLTFMISAAAEELFPGSRFHLKYSVSNGYYCKLYFADLDPLRGQMPPEELSALARGKILERLEPLKARVKALAAQAIPFEGVEEETSQVMDLFERQGRPDVQDILGESGQLYTTYYRMGDHIDYYFGPLVHDTGQVALFNLIPYLNGLLLSIPDRKAPERLASTVKQEKMHQVFQEYTKWNRLMEIPSVGAMNRAIAAGGASTLIKVGEALQEKRIARIADDITQRPGVKVILIAGPSSSGKTTFSKRLSVALSVNGLHPIALSLDDYFVEREETPLDENGRYDFESFHTLDLKLFNTQLKALLAGEKVNIPSFDFAAGRKVYRPDRWLQLKENDILLMEGIHALNPDLVPDIDPSTQYRIYASALTTLTLDRHNPIPTTDNRLLRRIIRDCKYRGTPCAQTLDRWASVRAGEEKWIFPFQENADAIFNSALVFELSVLKPFVEAELQKVPQQAPEYAEARRLLRLLSHLLPIQADEIPSTSLLREFVGGSSFSY